MRKPSSRSSATEAASSNASTSKYILGKNIQQKSSFLLCNCTLNLNLYEYKLLECCICVYQGIGQDLNKSTMGLSLGSMLEPR